MHGIDAQLHATHKETLSLIGLALLPYIVLIFLDIYAANDCTKIS